MPSARYSSAVSRERFLNGIAASVSGAAAVVPSARALRYTRYAAAPTTTAVNATAPRITAAGRAATHWYGGLTGHRVERIEQVGRALRPPRGFFSRHCAISAAIAGGTSLRPSVTGRGVS